MISETLHSYKMPNHTNTALITLILKPYKDPTQCSSHHSLTLINTDVKIISKSLALRLESVISSLVHMDQTGFI